MLAPFLTALSITAVGILAFLRWGERWHLMDRPSGQRKRHAGAKPLAGGALALGVLATSALYAPSALTWAVVAGGGGMAILGLDDDRHDRSPLAKLSGHIVLVALALVVAGVPEGVRLGPWSLPGWPLSAACAFLWVLSLTNAFNLIDGSDGLAAGLAALFAGGMLSGGSASGAWGTLTGALLAGCCAFWVFNRPPARAFLGDGGSYFVGFAMGMLSLHAAAGGGEAFDLLPWTIVFALPLADTAFAILRRLRARKPVFAADDRHIHHRLEARWGTWPMLTCLYGVAGLSALLGLWLAGWWR